jgi:hypothetical protein
MASRSGVLKDHTPLRVAKNPTCNLARCHEGVPETRIGLDHLTDLGDDLPSVATLQKIKD